MRRAFSLLLALLLLALPLAACTAEREETEDGLQIVATNFPLYDFARCVAGEDASVRLLLSPGAEPHGYEPSPSDMKAILGCDLFLYIGGESDAWAETLLGASEDVLSLRLIDSVEPLREEGDEHAFDEHIWTDPQNAVRMTEAIAEALCRLDGAHSDDYAARRDAFTAELDELDASFADAVARLGIRTVVFGDRFPFAYFTHRYGIEAFAAFPGCSHETEPAAGTMSALIDRVREGNIGTVFYTELSNHAVADTIADDTGAKTAMLHSCSNVTREEFDRGETYLSLMRQNLRTLEEAYAHAAD